MARKGIFGTALKNAMDGKFEEPSEAPVARKSSPNLARAEASIKEEDRRATRLISPALIRDSAFSDRIDASQGLDELVESIRDHGQQVPILVRRLADGGLEIVYGRRRLMACRALGVDVRATVMEMSDEEALIAQGVENNERLDTSFIERALFITRILGAGFSGVVVRKATGVNETLVYRMRGIVQAIPKQLITLIGPAHGAGRRQWEALATYCKGAKPTDIQRIEHALDASRTSAERLEQALAVIAKPRGVVGELVKTRHGGITVARTSKAITIAAAKKDDQAFLDYLDSRMVDLIREWEASTAPISRAK